MSPCGAFHREAPWRRAAAKGGLLALPVILVSTIIPLIGEAAFAPGTQVHRTPAPSRGAPLRASSLTSTDLPYHNQGTLICSDCHVMHASQQHGYDGGVSGYPWTGTPARTLLRKTTSTELCLACHDGRPGIPDVVGSDTNGLALRAAGFFGDLDVANYRGHNLARNLSSDPNDLCYRCHFSGSMPTASVQCIDCHNKHGNGYYRNLQWASWPGGEPEIRAYTKPGSSGLARYEADNVAYAAPLGGDGSFREVTNICIDCHHSLFPPYYTGNTSPFVKHPVTNTEWDAFHAPLDRTGAHTDPGHWVSGTGNGFDLPRLKFVVAGATDFAGATTVARSNEVFCLSCHQAHGSQNAFGLRWNYASGSSIPKSGCAQCHNY